MRRALVVAAALVASASPARAELTKAWSAAQSSLPGTTAVVVGLDLAALARSPAFGGVLALALASQRDVQAGLDLVKQRCKLDPAKAIGGIVVGADANQRAGVVFLQLDGVEQATASACIDTVALAVLGARPDRRIARRRDGNIIELSIDPTHPEPLARPSGQPATVPERLHVAWVTPQVLAIPLDVGDKAAFKKWLAGRGAFRTSRVGRALATLDKRASIVAASNVPAHFTLPFAVALGYGAITVGKANVLADLRLAVASPAAASAAVEQLHAGLKDLLARGKHASTVEANLRSVILGERRAEVTLAASIPEAQVLELLLALVR